MDQSASPFPQFHIEHIRPRKHGGCDDLSNLALACGHCNLHKSSNLSEVDPETDEIVELFHPRKESWNNLFAFDGPWIVGRTPSGRATVDVLNMNDPERVLLRSALLDAGDHEEVGIQP